MELTQRFRATHPDFGVTYFTMLDIYELGRGEDGKIQQAIAFGSDNVYLKDCKVKMVETEESFVKNQNNKSTDRLNLKTTVYNKCDGHCAYCGTEININNFNMNSVLPPHTNTDHKAVNFLPACVRCNKYKRHLSVQNFRKTAITLELIKESFYFELPVFAKNLQKELELAAIYYDKDFLDDEVRTLQIKLRDKRKALNETTSPIYEQQKLRITELKKEIKTLKAIKIDELLKDKFVSKLKIRQEIDKEFIQSLKNLIYDKGNDEMVVELNGLHLNYTHQTKNGNGVKLFEKEKHP